ncbi:hypothetical protein IFM51744_03683 [Aspergillus udagawae]|uniref:Uncharacterized protein n=1 Tax=Aspergillus udagawae TaxID=91492 RepID=A0A8H3RUJ3_9EURO|nr:hypothetical protein IFM51744_03683 [Aspergillus udagawae]GFF40414.1 hypothetical protein IFM46972_06205 [Aspergillus udagawae]GFF99505.1 hypothetical protein IFM53868_10324 [Aspergillus udagawae]
MAEPNIERGQEQETTDSGIPPESINAATIDGEHMSRQSSTSVSHGTDPAHSQCEGKLPFLRWWPAKSPVQAVAFKWQSTSGSAREQSRLRYGPLGKPSTGIPQFEIVA